MVLRTTSCPYCDHVLEYRNPFAKQKIGIPILVCPNCKGHYKTGMKFWKDFSRKEKLSYILVEVILRNLYTSFAFGISTSAVFFLGANALFGQDVLIDWAAEHTPLMIFLICIPFLTFILLHLNKQYKAITMTEEEWKILNSSNG